MTDRLHIVVLFGGPAGDGPCRLSHCPLGTAEVFTSRALAERYAETVPAEFEPHILYAGADQIHLDLT